MIGLSIIILVFTVVLTFDSVENIMSKEYKTFICIFLVICAVVNLANMIVIHKYGVTL
ncbi:hypothetical protein [Vibrio phage XZ1]|uniref:Uncharacterized protein n=1 Tax=Vibrio phage ValKK3 TaxID=1610855 RepID=A0A0D4DAQ6_9CAUD|nr:hypothetical protein AVU32_gp090 [Vibrio phage ValKK3]AJT60931.1 hypothetical protein [Vibrio phage ValKK3]UOL51357.1 hypothetical protein [Vibrio phage XZ1]